MESVIGAPLIAVSVMTLVMFFAMPADHNHKIRYVLWIYGLGLPCFAVVAGQVWNSGSKFLRRGGIIWVSLSAAVILFEGVYSFQHQVKLLCDYYQGDNEGEISLSRVFAGRYPADYFWDDLRGSAFENILADRKPVALGPIRVMSQPILGHLTQGQAFGERGIYFIEPSITTDQNRMKEFFRQRSIRYVIWEEGMPIPAPLRRMAILNEQAGEFFRVLVVDPR